MCFKIKKLSVGTILKANLLNVSDESVYSMAARRLHPRLTPKNLMRWLNRSTAPKLSLANLWAVFEANSESEAASTRCKVRDLHGVDSSGISLLKHAFCYL